MPIKRDEIQWDPIDVSQVQWEGGDSNKFRFASPETEQAGIGAIGRLAQAAEEYFTKPAAPAPANLQAQGYDPLAAYGERVVGNVPRDVTQISQGFTAPALAATGSALYNQPLETVAGMGSAALQGIGGFLADPAGTFAETPISTAMGFQAAQLARMPGRVAANVLAEAVYPKFRNIKDPMNRMLLDAFGKPEIQAALQEAPEGFSVQQALADVNVPKAQAVAREAMTLMPEETRAAQQAQGQARMEALSRIARTPQELAAAEEARSAAATANYREAFKQAAPNIPQEFFDRPSVAAAARVADTIESETGRAATPMERLHNIKKGLDQVLVSPKDHGLPGLDKAMKDTRKEFIDYLNTNPEYARARAEFASQSVPITRMQVAQELKKIVTDPTTEEATRGGMFARGMKEAPKVTKRATGESYYSQLEDLFTPEEMRVFESVEDEFRRTKLADEQAKLGAKAAPEVEELASSKVSSAMNIPFLNRTWTIANTLIKRSLGKFDEALAVKLATLMQDPAELNRAIAKARRYAKETEQGAQKLRERRQRIMQVTPTRAISGAVSVQNAMSPENRNAMAR